MSKGKVITDKGKKLTEIMMLRDKGLTLKQIAEQVGVNKETVRKWIVEATGTHYITHYSKQTKYDEGRDFALQYAGWSDREIAYDLGLSLEELMKYRHDTRGQAEVSMV